MEHTSQKNTSFICQLPSYSPVSELGIERRGSGRILPPSEDQYRFLYLYQGSVLFRKREHAFLIRGGNLLLMAPAQGWQPADVPAGCGHILLSVREKDGFVGHLLSDYRISDRFWLKDIGSPLHLEDFLALSVQDPPAPSGDFLFLLHQQIAEMADFLLVAPDGRAATAAQRACQYLNEHVYARVTLKELCEFTNLGKTQLTEAFRASYGLTPIAYLLEKKIEMAQARLTSTPQSISQIANDLGFYDMQHFIRAFKKKTGMSPSAFRRSRLRQDTLPECAPAAGRKVLP